MQGEGEARVRASLKVLEVARDRLETLLDRGELGRAWTIGQHQGLECIAEGLSLEQGVARLGAGEQAREEGGDGVDHLLLLGDRERRAVVGAGDLEAGEGRRIVLVLDVVADVTMLEGELPTLKAQKAHALPCPLCKSPFDTKAIATVVPDETWSKLQEAVIDAKLESRTEKLQREFDERLDNRLQELIANQGNTEAMVRMAAERIAKQARNEPEMPALQGSLRRV